MLLEDKHNTLDWNKTKLYYVGFLHYFFLSLEKLSTLMCTV